MYTIKRLLRCFGLIGPGILFITWRLNIIIDSLKDFLLKKKKAMQRIIFNVYTQ